MPLNLLSTDTRVATPFIKVNIGGFVFGVYDKETKQMLSDLKLNNNVMYPNYITTLTIDKINGQVNNYTLTIVYPLTTSSDPNFFEKVFSSVSESRKIVFSYGDLSMPTFCYRDEEALILDIKSNLGETSITYTIKAISSSVLLTQGNYTFRARTAQPSSVIYELLETKSYGLQEIFYGMTDLQLVKQQGLIPMQDKIVDIPLQTNVSIFDYLSYLVSLMVPVGTNKNLTTKTFYNLVVYDDVSGIFNGPYFKIVRVDNENSKDSINNLVTYNIDIGYPSQNFVIDFSIDNDESYSLLYKYNQKMVDSDYAQRIDDNGQLSFKYAPVTSSSNPKYYTTEADRTWWSKVTEYPIKATIKIKGLLRPAILMTYVKLNVYYYGRKYIASGVYIITKQTDKVDYYGYTTTLNMTRIIGDDDIV